MKWISFKEKPKKKLISFKNFNINTFKDTLKVNVDNANDNKW